MRPITAFILAKNEEPNIGRCLDSLEQLDIHAVVLDSGSVDKTTEIASTYKYASVEKYTYIDHLSAYNYICEHRVPSGQYALILDADMTLTKGLCDEIIDITGDGSKEIIAAPIRMFWNAKALRYGSLCPPKPFLFGGGRAYFMAMGHGERVKPQYNVYITQNCINHDDRKDYSSYLLTQVRYGINLIKRSREGNLRQRDKLRIGSPIMILASPLWSLFGRFGFLSGKVGFLYALDRLIAEAIRYRQSLADQIDKEK